MMRKMKLTRPMDRKHDSEAMEAFAALGKVLERFSAEAWHQALLNHLGVSIAAACSDDLGEAQAMARKCGESVAEMLAVNWEHIGPAREGCEYVAH